MNHVIKKQIGDGVSKPGEISGRVEACCTRRSTLAARVECYGKTITWPRPALRNLKEHGKLLTGRGLRVTGRPSGQPFAGRGQCQKLEVKRHGVDVREAGSWEGPGSMELPSHRPPDLARVPVVLEWLWARVPNRIAPLTHPLTTIKPYTVPRTVGCCQPLLCQCHPPTVSVVQWPTCSPWPFRPSLLFFSPFGVVSLVWLPIAP